jgi:sialic acid synthase
MKSKSIRQSNSDDCFFIAEIGNNHAGDLDLAKELVLSAKASGATAVKFQKRHNESLFQSNYANTPYTGKHSFGETYIEHRKAVELSENAFYDLKDFCERNQITFFCTPFDLRSFFFLEELGVEIYKVASADIVYRELLEKIASTGKQTILSTGGANFIEIERAVEIFLQRGVEDLGLLQCTAAYPCQIENLNLAVLDRYAELFPGLTLGLSDHDAGTTMAVVAYMKGARIFEKHFTIDRTRKGTDNAFSLEPADFSKMVKDIQSISKALGSGVKEKLDCERIPMSKMRKSAVSAVNLRKDQILESTLVRMCCPDDGLNGFEIFELFGKRVIRDVPAGEVLKKVDFK